MTGIAEPRTEAVPAVDLAAVLARRFALSTEVPARFFRENAVAISEAALAMARRFERGGRLLVFGEGPQASDAEHVAVEFVHPVLVGKRALPAIALPGDRGSLLSRLAVLAREQDIAMAIEGVRPGDGAAAGLTLATTRGLLTIGLGSLAADHRFVVDTMDPLVIQETHETLYHVLWELVHLFVEHRVAG